MDTTNFLLLILVLEGIGGFLLKLFQLFKEGKFKPHKASKRKA